MKRPTTKVLSALFDAHLKEFLKGEMEPESIPEKFEESELHSELAFPDEHLEDFLAEKGEIELGSLEVEMESESISDKIEELPLHEEAALPEPNLLIDVFYGTNRDRVGGSNLIKFYGTKRSDIKYGVCTVSLPHNRHLMGEIEIPKWWLLEFKEDSEKHFIISSIHEKSEKDFGMLLANKVTNSEDKDAFVFVHGYNVSFSSAAMRTAQIAFDIGFQGAPIMYSWPSEGKVLGYLGDRDDVKVSIPQLTKFLEDVFAWSHAKKIHLIAHSMGNVCLIEALLAVEKKFNGKLVFNNIILASPDIDRDIFIDQIAPQMLQYKEVLKRITLYASSQDNALSISRIIRRNEIPRAGEGGRRILVIEGIDTIDASMVGTDLLGHTFFAKAPTLINDLVSLIKSELPPEKRNLRPSTKNGLRYWKLPRVR